ncbi:hypothetical protein BCR33DRAFT_716616 [Rhizoclosmatium globosum]|uniref:Uncharacterized protein n=1 Tax=Rhizoclosmatium globosum TaxID=329046 RepID=A0A1Y2CG85_9FUNG|nr:hypothetical protein BCR33DRAFT_716616 [Rhizoclosmatium globosum]|eukprot:ORY45335.1 hypothetical protein BCR33DRAFT_716616 [Rhizoclosmatium globosum]
MAQQGSKRKRSDDDMYFGLSPFQLQQLRYHVHGLGVKATEPFKKMNEAIAALYGVRYNQITVLIKRIAKESYSNNDYTDPTQFLLAPPVIEPLQSLATNYTPTSAPTSTPMSTPIAQQQQSPKQQTVAHSSDTDRAAKEIVVIPKLRTVRQVETPRVYDQYLKYAGKLVADLNAEGLRRINDGAPSYEPVDFTKWTAAYKQQHGSTLFQIIKGQKTAEHKALMEKWKRQVEELKQHGPKTKEVSEKTFVRERNKLVTATKENIKKLAGDVLVGSSLSSNLSSQPITKLKLRDICTMS